MSTTDNSSPAAESVAADEDLLTQILSRVPVRRLIRFKLVSKQWLHLISDRHFSRLHFPKPRCMALVSFHRSILVRNSFDFIRIPTFVPVPTRLPRRRRDRFPPPTPSPLQLSYPRPPFFSDLESCNLNILQSCNGLLLLGSLDISYFVCNPTTNQIFKLPVLDGNLSVAGVSLAFDPKKFEGYKVICIWKSNSNPDAHGIDVYSSGTGQWRRAIDCNPKPLELDTEFERGVYCDGKIHWLSREYSVFFDVETERIGFLLMPNPLSGDWKTEIRYFGESMGHLHLIEYRNLTMFESSVLNVLELNKETLIWSIKYRFNLDTVGGPFKYDMIRYLTFTVYLFSILAVVRGENEDDTDLVLAIPGKLIRYNFKTGLTDLILEVEDDLDWFSPSERCNAFQYIESLYCI